MLHGGSMNGERPRKRFPGYKAVQDREWDNSHQSEGQRAKQSPLLNQEMEMKSGLLLHEAKTEDRWLWEGEGEPLVESKVSILGGLWAHAFFLVPNKGLTGASVLFPRAEEKALIRATEEGGTTVFETTDVEEGGVLLVEVWVFTPTLLISGTLFFVMVEKGTLFGIIEAWAAESNSFVKNKMS
ncbi:hypothetical protein LIER_27516 [Lithospermum erythrorhizon]|uniref:Uncharacterized protein n=1 Tax=Lithospermum erythrorhizon TaxID=34254 RepID=A0AAV3RDV8_LITER